MIGDRQFAIDIMDHFYDKWDPAGVGDEGKDHNEYEAYIGAFAGLVSTSLGSLTEEAIRSFVTDAEENMGGYNAKRISDATDGFVRILRAYEERSSIKVFASPSR